MNECGHCLVKIKDEPAVLANGKIFFLIKYTDIYNFLPFWSDVFKFEEDYVPVRSYPGSQVWHVNHLLCDLCNCRINDGERCVPKNGIILCFDCHIKTSRPTCKGCGDFIETNLCEALNSTWHPTCFQCSVCQKPLEVDFHQMPNRMCVHSDCFWNLQLRLIVCKDVPK